MLNQADTVELMKAMEQAATHMAIREVVQERCVALV